MNGFVRLLAAAVPLVLVARLEAQQDVAGEFTSANGHRRYVVHLPANTMTSRRPLVLVLHGCAQDARQIALGTGFSAAADSLGFVVLYPEQPVSINPSKCWKWFDPAHQLRGGGEPALLAELTRAVVRQFAADTSRIFVVGLSAGAAMAVNVLATYPELFVAGASHSGVAYRAAENIAAALAVMKNGVAGTAFQEPSALDTSPRPSRLIVIHGARDSIVAPINSEQLTGQWVRALERNRGAPLRSREEVTRIGGRDARVRTFADDRSVLIEFWLVHELGHAWSGGSLTGSYTDSAGPSASALILRFLGLN